MTPIGAYPQPKARRPDRTSEVGALPCRAVHSATTFDDSVDANQVGDD